jgi:hypothetical protein
MELEVQGGHRRGGEYSYVVTLPDGTKSEIPEWMTGPGAAEGSVVDSPTLSVSALQALRRLVDATTHGKECGLGRGDVPSS